MAFVSALQYYQELERFWKSNPTARGLQTAVRLLELNKNDLETFDTFLWAQITFGNGLFDANILKDVRKITQNIIRLRTNGAVEKELEKMKKEISKV